MMISLYFKGCGFGIEQGDHCKMILFKKYTYWNSCEDDIRTRNHPFYPVTDRLTCSKDAAVCIPGPQAT